MRVRWCDLRPLSTIARASYVSKTCDHAPNRRVTVIGLRCYRPMRLVLRTPAHNSSQIARVGYVLNTPTTPPTEA